MTHHGFLRVAAAVPLLRVADCDFNAEHILALMAKAQRDGVAILVFPEMAITGYTCADLFHQTTLQKAALEALARITRDSKRSGFSGLAVLGLPLVVGGQLYNCAAVLHRGRVLGVVPKTFIPNYKEFYERRWFTPATPAVRQITLLDEAVPFGTSLLFAADKLEDVVLGVEICEDLWAPIPLSSFQAVSGATVLVNLSASNEVIGKANYRRQLVVNQSGRCMAAYVYSSCGITESTTDLVFGGHCLIAENGVLLKESVRFQRQDSLLVADVDLDRLRIDRLRTNSFGEAKHYPVTQPDFQRVSFTLELPAKPRRLLREIDAHPFVPRRSEQLRERCEEIFHIQVAGLAKRLEHLDKPPVCIGVSGGLDSTLALVVACKTMDVLKVGRDRIQAFTLPGFGTTKRTLANAKKLIQQLGANLNEVDIRALCLDEMRVLGHQPFGIDLKDLTVEDLTARLQHLGKEQCHDLVFENVQARMRTSILMNRGFVVGTGDLSESALGWSTYNADHMSMYNPNASIPKTLVKFLVQWAAENEFEGEARRTLIDIVNTVISPELLPPGEDGQAIQATERVIGPFELHDFFLFHLLRYCAPPEKILFLAEHAEFDRRYSHDEIRHWLRVFIERFFANQFKRSCLPDGPKVGSISLSPRGDWRMPSDAQATLWLKWAEEESTRSVEQAAPVITKP